jgi:microcystin-dependent protein
MANQYLGQIASFGFGFAPKGWALCNGQTMAINQNQALFSLLGTTFGGNGIETFQLPNLQGCVAVGPSSGFVLGGTAGEMSHTLITSEMPAHQHSVAASSAVANSPTAPGNYPAAGTANYYSTASPNTTLGTGTSVAGQSQPHENRQPYLVINFCIALEGIFPSRN